jgi:ATP sulfurylase
MGQRASRSVKLRQNPHNVHEWLQRAKLYKDDVLIALWVGDRKELPSGKLT